MTWGARHFELVCTTGGDLIRFGVMPQGDRCDAQIDSEAVLGDPFSLQGYPSSGGPSVSADPNCRFAEFDGDTEVELHRVGYFKR